ncbi:hypothetical protein BU23DRAFT_18667 [Bimuria novae-zelandiae CBS 107.79]|uniref:Uncharacterized protein n=1 Tax=Bimuria novae-zelandiae CBS 107.79 TaxID=1447943 RepID=A0A6A5UXC7_9PLEO|nr:hypothetical protein BU23DRAFT_18667 [Bimuria novae-zelandiae CBS 107.79]
MRFYALLTSALLARLTPPRLFRGPCRFNMLIYQPCAREESLLQSASSTLLCPSQLADRLRSSLSLPSRSAPAGAAAFAVCSHPSLLALACPRFRPGHLLVRLPKPRSAVYV